MAVCSLADPVPRLSLLSSLWHRLLVVDLSLHHRHEQLMPERRNIEFTDKSPSPSWGFCFQLTGAVWVATNTRPVEMQK